MIQCKRKAPTFTAIRFADFREKASPGPGKPPQGGLYFQKQVTVEGPDHFRVGGFDFMPGEVLVLDEREEIQIYSDAEFAADYDVVPA